MTDQAMIEVRQWLREDYGLPLKTRLIGNGMANRPLKSIGRPAIALAQTLQFPRLTRGLYRPTTRPLSPAARANFGDTAPRSDVDVTTVKHIAYFKGCAMKMFFPEAAKASVNLLKKTGRTVEVPTVDCCGLPQHSHGMTEEAKALAKKNIAALEAYDLIVTDCGSCGATLKEYADLFADDPEMKERARTFSKKIMGLSEYLYAVGYTPTPHKELRVTYHASCHLNRGQGIHKEPQALLEQAVTYLPAANATMCCGGAGTFQLDFPETSAKVLENKYQDFKATGADIIVAECPSCLMQLGKIEQQHKDLKVLHISQVL